MVSINYYRKGRRHRGCVVTPWRGKIEKKMKKIKKIQKRLSIVQRKTLIGIWIKRNLGRVGD